MFGRILVGLMGSFLAINTTGCKKPEPEQAHEQAAIAIAAPIAGGYAAWVMAAAGVSVAAFNAVHINYVERTNATPGGFVWDMLTYSHPESKSRLNQYFRGAEPLTIEAQKIGQVVMKAADNLPEGQTFEKVKASINAKLAAKDDGCGGARGKNPGEVITGSSRCTLQHDGKDFKRCLVAVRDGEMPNYKNWRIGRCSCKEFTWTDCWTEDGKFPLGRQLPQKK